MLDHDADSYEKISRGFLDGQLFPDEIFQAPRHWAEKVYPNLAYFNEVDRGGHFAAWEEPELFAGEMRAAFQPIR